jgi:predicted lipid-binding transport protein (Tim44 family)
MVKSALSRVVLMLAMLIVAFCIVSLNPAEARMGGSFGSRGSRTFQAAPATNTAPSVGPVQRSMTPNNPTPTSPAQPAPVQPASVQPRPSFWSGLGGGLVGGLLGGLAFSGIFGMMFGHGLGGMGGGFSFLFQLILIGGAIWLATKFFRRRDASAPQAGSWKSSQFVQSNENVVPAFTAPAYGASRANNVSRDEIGITSGDLAAFERLLADVQEAFTREDHQGLRRLTTPEMVSYLSEELADNATHGLKNEVADLRFLNGVVAEAWREGDREYATMAMHWSAKDLMRNRQTGVVEKGDPNTPVETTELWTFTREAAGTWLLSAIQEARGNA